jgi:hypothetical protein
VVDEARLGDSGSGLAAETDGWFVGNVRDAEWLVSGHFADACPFFEGDAAPFAQVGFTLGVLMPREPSGLYHREANQETSSCSRASACSWSRGRSGACAPGTSSTARPGRSMSSSAQATGRV